MDVKVTFSANRAYPSIPTVGTNLESHTNVLKAIVESLQIGERRTRDLMNSFVRVGELVDAGLLVLKGDRLESAGGGEGGGDGSTGSGTAGNPTAKVALAPVNGVATTFMRSDAAPALSQTISPSWSGNHIFTKPVTGASFVPTSAAIPVRGLYAPAADIIALSTASVERVRVGPIGQVGVNGSYGAPGQVLMSAGSAAAAVWGTPATQIKYYPPVLGYAGI